MECQTVLARCRAPWACGPHLCMNFRSSHLSTCARRCTARELNELQGGILVIRVREICMACMPRGSRHSRYPQSKPHRGLRFSTAELLRKHRPQRCRSPPPGLPHREREEFVRVHVRSVDMVTVSLGLVCTSFCKEHAITVSNRLSPSWVVLELEAIVNFGSATPTLIQS